MATGAALVRLLTDADAGVQRAACEAMVRGEHHPAIEKLLPLLGSSERFVAFAATRACWKHCLRAEWQEAVLTSDNTRVFLQGCLALLST